MTAYAREDDIATVAGPDRVTLLRLRDPDAWPVALAGPAASIWDALADGPHEADEVVAAVAAGWDLPAPAVAHDVHELCRQLVEARLLVECPERQTGATR